MPKLKPITRRGTLKKGDRIFRINTGLGRYGNEREFVYATVLRSHKDPRRIVVQYDSGSVYSVPWRCYYRAN